jgi:hypothetical protein
VNNYSETIKTLSETKDLLINKRHELLRNLMWERFQEFWDLYTFEICEIDAKIQMLIEAKN